MAMAGGQPGGTGRRLTGLLAAATGVAMAAAMAGWCSDLWWACELPAHFRVQSLIFALFAAPLLWWGRRRAWAVAAGILLLHDAALVLPSWRPAACRPAEAQLQVASANVHTANRDFGPCLEWLRRTRPDAVALLEVDAGWCRALDGVRDLYPWQLQEPRDDNFGLALLATREPLRHELLHLGEVPVIVADLRCGSGSLRLLAAHPLPPISQDYAATRDEQFRRLAALAAGSALPPVLVGDLNATPWCLPFRRLCRDGGLAPVPAGLGAFATWPSFSWLLRIPIDHALVGRGAEATQRTVGPPIGSDHLPITVGLRLPISQ